MSKLREYYLGSGSKLGEYNLIKRIWVSYIIWIKGYEWVMRL